MTRDAIELAKDMVESTTEYDWKELPRSLQNTIESAAILLLLYIEYDQPIKGEIVTERKEIESP